MPRSPGQLVESGAIRGSTRCASASLPRFIRARRVWPPRRNGQEELGRRRRFTVMVETGAGAAQHSRHRVRRAVPRSGAPPASTASPISSSRFGGRRSLRAAARCAAARSSSAARPPIWRGTARPGRRDGVCDGAAAAALARAGDGRALVAGQHRRLQGGDSGSQRIRASCRCS